MPKLYVDFNNFAPDTVEQREVDSLEIAGLSIPADAVNFNFTDEKGGYIAPSYWVTETVDKGSLEELAHRHPKAHPMFKDHGDKNGAAEYALVTWADPEGKYDVNAVLPICADIAFVERTSGRLLFEETA